MGKVGSFLDSVIGTFNPKAGFERTLNRARMLNMQTQVRKYEGAADGRRASSWIANTNPSVNQLVTKDLSKLVLRSRELNINNAYGKKAPYVIANNVIGTGIVATPYVADIIEKGSFKKVPNKNKIEKAISQAYKDWAENLSCDYNGDFNFYGLQHLVWRTVVVSGEALIIRKRVTQDVNKYGFQLLVLEGDYIDTTKDTQSDKDGGYTFKGVKYDKNYKRTGYWLFDRHPSEANPKSTFVKIEDVIHVYDVERAGQNRGVPAAAPTMLTQKDLGDYMDAELLAKKGAACFSAIVQKTEDLEGGSAAMDNLENLEPGTVQYLNPGETIHFPTLPQNPGLSEFVKVQHRGIAAGYLMPYENLTGDLSNVTFISGRLGQLDFKKQIEYWTYTVFVPRFCDKVFIWFTEGAKIVFSIENTIEIKAKWTAPRRELMDPTKEIAAMKDEVRSGFSSWQEKVRENGYDPEQVLQELAEDQKRFVDLGLMPDWTQFFELTAKMQMNASKKPQDNTQKQ